MDLMHSDEPAQKTMETKLSLNHRPSSFERQLTDAVARMREKARRALRPSARPLIIEIPKRPKRAKTKLTSSQIQWTIARLRHVAKGLWDAGAIEKASKLIEKAMKLEAVAGRSENG
jgi:hypothetical protein